MATTTMITAYFRNTSVTQEHWIVKDASNNGIILDRTIGPKEQVATSLNASDSGTGEIYYRRAEQSIWTHQAFVYPEQVVNLF